MDSLVEATRRGGRRREQVAGRRGRTAGPRRKGALRAQALSERETDTVGEALLLRGKSPEETLEIMFEMVEFAEEISRVADDA